MKAFILILALIAPSLADAGTSCTTRKSGATTITSCSSSGHGNTSSTCRSRMSGSTRKTYCS